MSNTTKSYTNPPFDLATFSKLNELRCDGPFKCGEKGNLYWATALAEEVGELAGAIKKLDRGFNERELKKMKVKLDAQVEKDGDGNPKSTMPMDEIFKLQWTIEKLSKLGKEAADIFTYLDLMMTKNNLNLWDFVKNKFNEVSDEMKCPEFKI